jgi:hypothetical protein
MVGGLVEMKAGGGRFESMFAENVSGNGGGDFRQRQRFGLRGGR